MKKKRKQKQKESSSIQCERQSSMIARAKPCQAGSSDKRRNDQIDKCDYELNAYKIFSQLKKEHVVIAHFCYDVVYIYHKLFQILRQRAR
jgi:hypothetical protein